MSANQKFLSFNAFYHFSFIAYCTFNIILILFRSQIVVFDFLYKNKYSDGGGGGVKKFG